MAGKSKLYEDFLNSCDKSKKWLAAYSTRADPDCLHRLRLEIKKMRAIFFVLEKCESDYSAPKQMDALKPLFRLAGRIRDQDVQFGLINTYIHHLPLQHRQNQALASSCRQFIGKMGSWLELFDHLEQIPPVEFQKPPKKCVRRLVARQIKKVRKSYWPKIPLKELHLIRKRIKRLLYVDAVLGKGMVDTPRFNRRSLDHLQDSIGKLHDLDAATARIPADAPGRTGALKKMDLEKIRLLKGIHARFREMGEKN